VTPWSAARGVAAVHGDGLPADEAGVGGQQEGCYRSDLVGAAESPQFVFGRNASRGPSNPGIPMTESNIGV